MTKDQVIVIEKVANGYIVRPQPNPFRNNEFIVSDEIFVFETFDALTKWLAEHFMKLGDKKADG